MAYPYDQISNDEEVLIHDHSHWKTLIMPGICGAMMLLGTGYLAVIATGTALEKVAWVGLGLVAVFSTVRCVLLPVLRWKTKHFVVTTEKIMFREGILKRSGIDIPLRRIASVRYEHDLNDRLFGCGTLIIEAMSDQPLTFTDISRVEYAHNLIYAAVDGNADKFMFTVQ